LKTDLEDLVAIARVVKPRGLRGEMAAEILTDFPERFEGLKEVIVVPKDGEREYLKIEDFWFQKGRLVLKFYGVDAIEAAERLRNAEICVLESQAVELGDDEFYDWQLEGCDVLTLDGMQIGKVRELMRTGGTELLVVQNDEKEILIPFAESVCPDVDIENKVIRIDPPEGLLEF
jgi:16S rRNA processing protein RimM